MTKLVIDLINKCDFHVIVIVSDNNRINRNMFSLLKGSSPEYFINDIDPPYITFLMYDFVHILKNIRNCWLNKKDGFQSFIFPDFNNSDELLTAKFSDLKHLYHHNNNISVLLQHTHKLNHKTLYPSNLERYKVSLACNVFHESTYSALKAEYESGSGVVTSHGTYEFIPYNFELVDNSKYKIKIDWFIKEK